VNLRIDFSINFFNLSHLFAYASSQRSPHSAGHGGATTLMRLVKLFTSKCYRVTDTLANGSTKSMVNLNFLTKPVHLQVVGEWARRSRAFTPLRLSLGERCSEFSSALAFRTVKRAEARAPDGTDNFGMPRHEAPVISHRFPQSGAVQAGRYLQTVSPFESITAHKPFGLA